MLDKLPLDNLVETRIRVTNIRCVLCLNEEENITHLLFTCQSVRKSWYLCDLWVGVQYVHHCRAKEHFLSFEIPQ